jgi:hypothetical protein
VSPTPFATTTMDLSVPTVDGEETPVLQVAELRRQAATRGRQSGAALHDHLSGECAVHR